MQVLKMQMTDELQITIIDETGIGKYLDWAEAYNLSVQEMSQMIVKIYIPASDTTSEAAFDAEFPQ